MFTTLCSSLLWVLGALWSIARMYTSTIVTAYDLIHTEAMKETQAIAASDPVGFAWAMMKTYLRRPLAFLAEPIPIVADSPEEVKTPNGDAFDLN